MATRAASLADRAEGAFAPLVAGVQPGVSGKRWQQKNGKPLPTLACV
jgi:hypothetical protein